MTRTRCAVATVVAVVLLGLAGCTSIELPDPPPVPTGPTSTPTRSSEPDPSFTIGGPKPTQVLPTPTGYPEIDLAGKDACTLLRPADRGRFGLQAPDPSSSAADFCPLFRTDAKPSDPFDTAIFLSPGTTLADWAADQPDYATWVPVRSDGATGVMSNVQNGCRGILMLSTDAALQVEVDLDDDEPTCARATDILLTAYAGLRAQA